MGYTTDFNGAWDVLPPLTKEHREYLLAFNEMRHVTRDPLKLINEPDPLREAVGLPIGQDGCYFIGEPVLRSGFGNEGPGVTESNTPPGLGGYMGAIKPGAQDYAQPGLYCQWRPNADGTQIEWDEGEKFYEYVEWIRYLTDHFLTPWGYSLAGTVYWQGEESDDRGRLVIDSPLNRVKIQNAQITYGP